MQFTDTLKIQSILQNEYDDEGNPVEGELSFVSFGREKNAIILPNDIAAKVRLNDGSEYTYSYQIIVKLKKELIPLIPIEGHKVYIHKNDGTIEGVKEVKGFVTLKSKYLKIWV